MVKVVEKIKTKVMAIWITIKTLLTNGQHTLDAHWMNSAMLEHKLRTQLTPFISDTRAESGAGKVIQLFIIAILAGALLPTAIAQLVGVNTSNWSTTDVLMWGLLSTFIILAVVLYIMPIDRIKRL